MTLSVLICTYNRSELLARCLRALVIRSEDKPDEVVVVNGGDERADAVVRSFASRRQESIVPQLGVAGPFTPSPFLGPPSPIDIKLIKTINKNLATSRNVGLPHCTGDIIAMTDDDAEVYPDWVGHMKRIHAEHPEAGGVGGPVIAAERDSLISRISDRVTFSTYTKPRTVRTLPGVNISYKWAVVDKVGSQDESLFRGEDVDYNWRAQRLGWTIYYDPAVRVLHHHRPTLRALLNQHYMYGRAYYLVRRKWPEMYCVYPHSLRRPKDIVKAVNFVAAAVYEPIWYGARLERTRDKLASVPILFLNQLAWRIGMVQQKFAH